MIFACVDLLVAEEKLNVLVPSEKKREVGYYNLLR